MRQAWRWYGPDAGISLDAVRQAGATDIVSALHHVPIGDVWTHEEIAKRKALIETTPVGRTPLTWSVVESIPIPDAVKRTGGAAKLEIEKWIASMEAVAAHDIKTICYNFMPVVDWTRTDLDYMTPTGSTAMRFDQNKFAAFDLHILQRENAKQDYSETDQIQARKAFDEMSENEIANLTRNITSALPGSTTEPLTVPQFREKLAAYAQIDASHMRQNLIDFLTAVTPAAEACGVKLTLHPDDPPRSLFGLPRIASSAQDYAALFEAVPSQANGMCYCTGSLGVRAENDLKAIAKQFSSRIYFAHLRATKREEDPRTFHESAHLEGDVDMVAVIKELLSENATRAEGENIIFRPDHGQCMLSDLDEVGSPGYPAVGRLRGLAELRGIIAALQSTS